MSEPITIQSIAVKPEHDPYVNIDGIVSKTTLKLDPRDRTAWVTQEYQDNSTLSDEWHELVVTWNVNSHPSESDMREWITDHLAALTTICDGFDEHWNGNNFVGHYTPEAQGAIEAIHKALDNDDGPTNHYEAWTVGSWLEQSISEIGASMTDEELEDFAEGVSGDDHIVIVGDILAYITDRRNALKQESE